METKTVNVYKFSELSDKAKHRAKYDDQAGGDWSRADDYLASIRKLAAHFGGEVLNYEIDWTNGTGPSSMEFEMPDMFPDEIKKKLKALGSYNKKTLKGEGACILTGCCTDEDVIDGFRVAFMRGKERNLNVLMQAAFAEMMKNAWAEYESDYSDEVYSEVAEMNGWRYYEDGRLFA